jgi:hypothetical protein
MLPSYLRLAEPINLSSLLLFQLRMCHPSHKNFTKKCNVTINYSTYTLLWEKSRQWAGTLVPLFIVVWHVLLKLVGSLPRRCELAFARLHAGCNRWTWLDLVGIPQHGDLILSGYDNSSHIHCSLCCSAYSWVREIPVVPISDLV